jgi:hypothetical protein
MFSKIIVAALASIPPFPFVIDSGALLSKERGFKCEILIIGPLNLGEVYQNMSRTDREKGSNERIPAGGGPKQVVIVKALSKCKIYLIGGRKKATRNRAAWEFCSPVGAPGVLVGGTLSFTLKDDKGKDFGIHVKAIRLISLDYVVGESGKPRLARGRLAVELGTSPYCVTNMPGGDVNGVIGLSFLSGPLYWDLTGKLTRRRE